VRFALLAALLLISGSAFSQDRTVTGYRLPTPPTIDGVIDTTAEWKDVPSFSGLVDTQTGVPAPEGGTFWLAFDQKFVYFAARLDDASPGTIQASEYRTNVSLRGNDTVSLQIDPFGKLTDFNTFSMNARGATNIQIAGGRAAKREWLGDILAMGRITKEGWEVEARIPWSIMRLPSKGVHELRFNVFRDHRRLQRGYAWRFTGGGQIENFGRWLNVAIPPGEPRTLKLLPYGYAGFDERVGLVANSGLDFRTALTERLDLVGTINPDFRNIENQVLSLDFSYFERLASESRPFFLEGAQFFRTSGDAPLFASQRIRGFDTGIKAFGKLDDQTDVGIIDAIDFGSRNAFGIVNPAPLGTQNAFAGKVRRQLTARSSVEAAYVGLNTPGLKNDAGFLQYSAGLGPYFFFGQLSGTNDTTNGKGYRANAGMYYGHKGLQANLEHVQISSDFLPRLGFAPERDLAGFRGGFGVSRPTTRGMLIETGYGVYANSFKTLDGEPYRNGIGANGSLTFKNGLDLDFGMDYTRFRGFDDRTAYIGVERPRGEPYRRWAFDYAVGRRAGQPYQSFSPSIAYRPVNELQLNLSYQRVTQLGDTFSQTILSASYDLGADRSISGRLVQRREGTNYYLALRRSGNRGAEYFLILGDPNAPTFRTSLILKVAVPLELRL
jgi:hypothetical protein